MFDSSQTFILISCAGFDYLNERVDYFMLRLYLANRSGFHLKNKSSFLPYVVFIWQSICKVASRLKDIRVTRKNNWKEETNTIVTDSSQVALEFRITQIDIATSI